MEKLVIVSRKSNLALYQANFVKQAIEQLALGITVIIEGISTKGDQILDRSLAKIGGKGLFVKELEEKLLSGQADIAVHSMKDVPAILPHNLQIAAILDREDPRDALVSLNNLTLDKLPTGATIGTSSLRRQIQLQLLRPDIHVKPLRGNVETRLSKLGKGEYDAIILAAAGLHRLSLGEHISQYLSAKDFIPAVGQGVLGIECRANDKSVVELISKLHNHQIANCILAERAMNLKLGGNCSSPIAGHAVLVNNKIKLSAMVGDIQNHLAYYASTTGDINQSELVGNQAAEILINQGALQAIKC